MLLAQKENGKPDAAVHIIKHWRNYDVFSFYPSWIRSWQYIVCLLDSKIIFKTDITKVPPDHNPGVANAYMQAGFLPELSPCSVNFSKALSRFFLQAGS